MILKKPYAFLIKHFKLIHLLLTICLAYLSIKINAIVTIFRSYATNGYYTSLNNLAGKNINFYMYLIVILVISIAVTIYILFKTKEKPRKFYVALIIYYVIIFVLFTFSFSLLQTMETTIVDVKALRAYRDIAIMFSLPQYFFLIMSLLRGIGFDYKKFDFKKDISELEIEAKDNEEFEFNVNIPGYKIERKFRRTLRELKYYVIENTFTVVVLGIMVVAFVVTMIFMNKRVYSKTYNEESNFIANNFKITVLNTTITPYSYGGKVINKEKYYLVLLCNVQNLNSTSKALDLDDFRLIINNQNIYPAPNNREYFIDIGEPYYEGKIKSQVTKNIVIIFELNKDQIYDSYLLKIDDNFDYTKGEIIARYKQIKLSPVKMLELNNPSSYTYNQNINFKDSIIKNSSLIIKDYAFMRNYKYNYKYCPTTTKCYDSIDTVSANYKSDIEKTLLVINYELTLDEKSAYYSNIKNKKEFFNHFMKLTYTINDKTYSADLVNKTPNSIEKTLILEVNKDIEEASNILLNFNIRNQKYNVVLK